MNLSRPPATDATIRESAARWTVRRDRGLSAKEAIDYELWLAADGRHAAAMKRAVGAWSVLDRIPDDLAGSVLAAATRRRIFRRRLALFGALPAAAALVLAGVLTWRPPAESPRPFAQDSAVAGDPRELILSDGTVVRLNSGSEVIERFTAAERQVVLARGEAHFDVTKNPARPFIVQAGALQVRAVGTAFNVNLQSSRVEVLVTEGRVQLAAVPADAAAPAADAPALPLIEAGERAVLTGGFGAGSPPVVVTRIDDAEISRELAWQAPLLRLGGATLAELVLEFQRRSGQRVVLADPALAQLRVGGRFRADDAAGFASLMATTLDLEVENAPDGTLVLRKKHQESR